MKKKDKIYVMIVENDKISELQNILDEYHMKSLKCVHKENSYLVIGHLFADKDVIEESFARKISLITRWVKTLPLKSFQFFDDTNSLPQ